MLFVGFRVQVGRVPGCYLGLVGSEAIWRIGVMGKCILNQVLMTHGNWPISERHRWAIYSATYSDCPRA